MRELVLFIATSLDGFIAGRDGGIDWLFHDQDYGYTDFFASVGTVIMGRKTWELSQSFSSDPYPEKDIHVFTRQAHTATSQVQYVSSDVASFVRDLKQGSGNAIWLVGGGEIASECYRHGLIDTYRIFIHPVVLGSGIPLFLSNLPTRKLVLERAHAFDSGLVELRYRSTPDVSC